MTQRETLARQALAAALRVRNRAGIGLGSPICPFDLAEQLGVEVWFTEIASLEGMFVDAERPLILVAAERPAGRQRFSAAHELGHRVFHHGTRVDQILSAPASGRGSEEFLADAFGGFLLVPKSAAMRGFTARGWRPEGCTPEQAYIVGSWLGVSYEGLVTHLTSSLKIMDRAHANRLLKSRPSDIGNALAGRQLPGHLIVADQQWMGRAIDVCVGDHILAPSGVLAPDGIVEIVDHLPTGDLLRTVRPGIGRLIVADGRWSAYVRAMRARYSGRAIYRHLEDPDCD